MTLIVNANTKEVINTESTDVKIGGNIRVGGSFTNLGKVKVFEGGNLQVDKEFLNHGDLLINDPERLKQIILESLKTTKTISEFGLEILKKLNLLK